MDPKTTKTTPTTDPISDLLQDAARALGCPVDTVCKEIAYLIREGVPPEQIYTKEYLTTMLWNKPLDANPIRDRVQLMLRPTPSDGVVACMCGSFNTRTDTKQTRSGDESMTVFITCKDCGRSFKM